MFNKVKEAAIEILTSTTGKLALVAFVIGSPLFYFLSKVSEIV